MSLNVGNIHEGLNWFRDSPDAGHPDCICSHCDKLIGEDEVPFRMLDKQNNLEARLHMKCASSLGYIKGYSTEQYDVEQPF